MLYTLAHKIQHYFPWIWEMIEDINSLLFAVRYGHRLKGHEKMLEGLHDDYIVRAATIDDAKMMEHFFDQQSEYNLRFFHPHKFDATSLLKLLKRRSMLMYLVCDKEGGMVGYFFIRCFFIGKGFRGYIVDERQQKRGIGKLMGKGFAVVCQALQFPTYKTISKDNPASLALAHAVCEVEVLEELPNNELYIRCN